MFTNINLQNQAEISIQLEKISHAAVRYYHRKLNIIDCNYNVVVPTETWLNGWRGSHKRWRCLNCGKKTFCQRCLLCSPIRLMWSLSALWLRLMMSPSLQQSRTLRLRPVFIYKTLWFYVGGRLPHGHMKSTWEYWLFHV